MMYDEFFIQGDKPYAENLNDCILVTNAFDFNVTVPVPNGFSNGRFMSTTETRKCGVCTIRLPEILPEDVTINEEGQLVFTDDASVELFVYPNFNQFGNWEKISWEESISGAISIDLLTKDRIIIQTDIPNGIKLTSNVELTKLDEIIVKISGGDGVVLEDMTFLYKKKQSSNVESSSIKLPEYSTTEEMEQAIEEAVSTKADASVVEEHIEDDDSHVTAHEKEIWDSKADGVHNHEISDVTNLTTSLSGKQDSLISGTNIKTINDQSLLGSGNITIQSSQGVSSYNDLTDKPSINGNILSGNKTSANLGLAPSTHTHELSEIGDLTTELEGKADVVHTHEVSDIDTLQTILDGKAGTSHTHTKSSITDFPETVEMVFTFLDGTVHTYNVYAYENTS